MSEKPLPRNKPVKIIGLVGGKPAERNALLETLLSLLTRYGFRVSAVIVGEEDRVENHAVESVFESGAKEVLLRSSRRLSLLHRLDADNGSLSLGEIVSHMSGVDLVFISGLVPGRYDKIELCLGDEPRCSYAKQDPSIVAVVSEKVVEDALGRPNLFWSDEEAIAHFIALYSGLITAETEKKTA